MRFLPEAYEKEHSIEVQLPFLQTVLKDFTIVPILIGLPTKETFSILIDYRPCSMTRTIIVASSDLSHYHDYAKAKEMDGRSYLQLKGSPRRCRRLLSSGNAELCGAIPSSLRLKRRRRSGATTRSSFPICEFRRCYKRQKQGCRLRLNGIIQRRIHRR